MDGHWLSDSYHDGESEFGPLVLSNEGYPYNAVISLNAPNDFEHRT